MKVSNISGLSVQAEETAMCKGPKSQKKIAVSEEKKGHCNWNS